MHCLYIPNWRPATLNEMAASNHWAKRSKLKAIDREMVAGYWLASRLPRATGARRVSMLVVLPKGQRCFDRDSMHKSLLDALVHCHALHDDSPAWCHLGTVEYARALGGAWGTVVTLEEV